MLCSWFTTRPSRSNELRERRQPLPVYGELSELQISLFFFSLSLRLSELTLEWIAGVAD